MQINKKYSLKSFMYELFRPIIDEKGNLPKDEFLTLYKSNENYQVNEFYNNIDELMYNAMNPQKHFFNTFFTLGTNNGKTRQTVDTITRTCIAFDFDKKDYDKDFNIKDIYNLFSQIGLWYHIIIDSGYGYHVYVLIEPTQDIELIRMVQHDIGVRLNCDKKALTRPQILRVPESINIKYLDDKKRVNIVHIEPAETIQRKSIKELARRYCGEKFNNQKNIDYLLNKKIAPCIKEILSNGSVDGNRNKDLQKIVIVLRNMNKTLSQIKNICVEWNSKCEPPMTDNKLKYQVEYIFEKLKVTDLNCKDCEYKSDCYSKIESDFNYLDGEPTIRMSENIVKKVQNKKSSREGVVKMNGNMLVIYALLKNHSDGLYRDEILSELQYDSKRNKVNHCCMSNPTLTKTLKELEENKFITVETIDRKKFYTLNKERVKEECTFIISMAATYECIKGNITFEEYELYCYMRYLHNKIQREDPKAEKGNILRINQEDIAKKLNISRERVTQMIKSLLEEKLLTIWYRAKKSNSMQFYNYYKLNY